MKVTRLLRTAVPAAFLLSLLAGSASAGAVFISGDDSDSGGHCENSNCGKMIGHILSKLYGECGATAALPPGILAIGANNSTALTAIQNWNLPVNGGPNAPITHCNTISCIQSVNFAAHRLLYVASYSQETAGGLTQAQLDALNLRQAAIQDWVNDQNGRVMALTETRMNNAYGWLPNPLVSVNISGDDAYRTDAPGGPPGTRTIELEFPGNGATDINIDHNRYHNYFSGPSGWSGLKPLLELRDASPRGSICPITGQIPDPSAPTDPNFCIWPPVAIGCCSCQLIDVEAPSCVIGGGPFVAACQTTVVQTISVPPATVVDPEGGVLDYVWSITNASGDLSLSSSGGTVCIGTTCSGSVVAGPAIVMPLDPITVSRDTSMATACSEAATLTLTVTDSNAHSSSCQATMGFASAGPLPTVTAPPDVNIPCNEDTPAPPEQPGFTSICDPNPIVTLEEHTEPHSCPTDYVLVRTWTLTDACGRTANDSQQIHVVDLPPVITLGPSTMLCGGPPPLPTATDDCSTVVPLTGTFVTLPGACPAIAVRRYTWTATDSCGHVTTAVQDVNVLDLVPPVLVGVPGNVTASCVAPPPAQPTATDSCNPSPTITFTETRVDGNCPDRFTLTRTWTASDGCNQTSASQIVTVVDNTPPTITGVPPSATVACDQVPAPAQPTASDNCDPSPALVFNEVRTNGNCPDRYTLTRTWTATDRCGQVTPATQVLTVVDDDPPALSGVPSDATVECDAVPAPALPTAVDNCDPDPTITFVETRIDGTCPESYTLVRTWTATDRCGNASTQTQVVTVVDTTPPVVDATGGNLACLWPPNHKYVCFDRSSFPEISVTDNCSGTVSWQFAGCASDQCDDAPCRDYPGQNGDGDTVDDCIVRPGGEGFCVRSERAGTNPEGRHYGVAVVATDGCGNTSAPPTVVGYIYVPHDQSPHESCIKPPNDGRK